MNAKKFTRSELLDLVWSAPMRTIAADLGLSDVGLKKAVQKAGLPTPPQGHWNRVAAGKKVDRKPTLPLRGFGASDEIWIGGDRWAHRHKPLGPNDSIPPVPSFDEPMDSVRRRAQKALGKVSVARDLFHAHPAIRGVLDDEAKRAEKVRNSSWTSSWNSPRFTAPIDQRRLRLLNAICLGLARAGIKARLWQTENAVVHVETSAVGLPMQARKLLTKGKKAESDHRLSIVVGALPGYNETVLAQWDDTDGRKLETIITDIAVEIVVLLEQQYRASVIHHHEWLVAQRAAAIEAAEKAQIEAERRERERLEKLEQARIDRLIGEAEQLRLAQAIRTYVAEATALAPMNSLKVDRWRTWALDQADRMDPVQNGSFLKALDELG